jgi:hypothetical protein
MKVHNPSKSKSSSIVKGSILAIPLSDHEWALGQVIHPGTNFYLGVALRKFDYLPQSVDIEKEKLSIFSWTNDAEVFRGNWKVLGKLDYVPKFILPEYKVYIDGKVVVESFDSQSFRVFDDAVDTKLNFRKIRSPLIVQDAVQAALGYRKWQPTFEEMLR